MALPPFVHRPEILTYPVALLALTSFPKQKCLILVFPLHPKVLLTHPNTPPQLPKPKVDTEVQQVILGIAAIPLLVKEGLPSITGREAGHPTYVLKRPNEFLQPVPRKLKILVQNMKP